MALPNSNKNFFYRKKIGDDDTIPPKDKCNNQRMKAVGILTKKTSTNYAFGPISFSPKPPNSIYSNRKSQISLNSARQLKLLKKTGNTTSALNTKNPSPRSLSISQVAFYNKPMSIERKIRISEKLKLSNSNPILTSESQPCSHFHSKASELKIILANCKEKQSKDSVNNKLSNENSVIKKKLKTSVQSPLIHYQGLSPSKCFFYYKIDTDCKDYLKKLKDSQRSFSGSNPKLVNTISDQINEVHSLQKKNKIEQNKDNLIQWILDCK